MAAAAVEAVQDGTKARFRLAADFYHGPRATNERGRYGLAELSFLRWEIERGVLDQPAAEGGGSHWWRAVNDRLLRDKVEADLLTAGFAGAASSRNVELWLEFISAPSASTWYRAHNASIVAGYLGHESLAASEHCAERFMMNVALVRVLYAHALSAAPRLALGALAPLGRLLGDPRRRSVRIFLDLRDVFPERYPLDGWTLEELLAAERRLGRALDYGIIASRVTELYEFAAASLEEPRITMLESDGALCYSWPAEERAPWVAGIRRPMARAIAIATGRRHPVR
ncbi:MAG: hypothetical protein ACRDL1_08510 [Solirubrobacterales bacterium]